MLARSPTAKVYRSSPTRFHPSYSQSLQPAFWSPRSACRADESTETDVSTAPIAPWSGQTHRLATGPRMAKSPEIALCPRYRRLCARRSTSIGRRQGLQPTHDPSPGWELVMRFLFARGVQSVYLMQMAKWEGGGGAKQKLTSRIVISKCGFSLSAIERLGGCFQGSCSRATRIIPMQYLSITNGPLSWTKK